MPDMPPPRHWCEALRPDQMPVLHRIAKNAKKGARPFFVDAREMMVLRELAEAHLNMNKVTPAR